MKAKTSKKRVLSLLLAVLMVFSLLPMSAFAATVDNGYAPGTYTGTAQGHKGAVNVTVTLTKDGDKVVISDIQATGDEETPSFWAQAVTLLDQIKAKNGTDGVDAVSGATRSSNGILNATNDALAKAAVLPTGTGTKSDPLVISNAAQLVKFAELVDAGETYEGKFVTLGADIDLSSVANFNPIGDEAKDSAKIFQGTFDGKGYTISGLKINTEISVEGNYGLFSVLGNKAIVKNINVKDAEIAITDTAGQLRVGVFAGDTQKTAGSGDTGLAGRIDNCSATGTMNVTTTGDTLAFGGGIVGRLFNGGVVTNCWSDVDITVKALNGSKSAYAGGIAGTTGNYAIIANCATFGDHTAIAPLNSNFGGMSGGIVSMLAGKQYNVYATGNMTVGNGGSAHKWVGVLDGEVTTSGLVSGAYPATGAIRLHNYFNNESVLTIDTYNSDGSVAKTEKIDAVGCGYTEKSMSYDKIIVTTPMAAADMAKADFVNTLNGNIKEINGILAAYKITGIALREWQLVDGRVLPTGDVWTSGDIDASIFASGTGTAEDPYIINTAEQLTKFAGSLNDKIDYTDKYVKLGNDIAVSGEWSPIGGSDYLFNGSFDGDGHSISGLALGTKEKAYELDKENLYIGLFGVLGPKSVVKNVNVDVEFYTHYAATAYVAGIAGVMQGSTVSGNFTGAVIDNCSVSGVISHVADKGNQFVGGLVGMQYKGAIINSSSTINASCVVKAGDLVEVGGLVGLNNRGLVANCMADCVIYGSGNRENGNEGMAVVSALVACNAGALVNSYASGDVSTEEHSTYAGMVSGWVTGIGKTYNCWFDLDSTMTLKVGDDNPQKVSPVESIGTKVSSGVNDEGDAYTGGLVDKMTGVKGADAATAAALNASFAAFPIEITAFGISNDSLKTWAFGTELGFGTGYGKVVYVQPECEKVVKPEPTLLDGTWYGRDNDKKSVVSIEVKDGKIVSTAVVSGETSGDAYDAALEKAKFKATYGDFSDYAAADPSKFAGGSGTQADPYLISNEAQLRYLSSSVNADVNWKGVYFKQTADITLHGQWQPIGWALMGEVNGKGTQVAVYPFSGNYDGCGYTISGLTVGSESEPADMMTAGLFGLTSGDLTTNELPTASNNTVTIKNVTLDNVYINVSTRYQTYIGGLVGNAQYGIYIDNCTVTGKVTSVTSESFSRAGGLAGSVLRGSVTNSGADVEIVGITDTNHVYAGGLYGMDNRVTTVNCYALGNVTGNSTNNNKVHIGGLVGQAGGIHINCYAAGDVVSLKTTTDVGILNGRSGGITIDRNCYYNTEALLKQGDTVISPAIAIGVNANNQAVVSNVVGKTAAELKSADFAKLMNANISADGMEASMKVVEDGLAAQAERGFAQVNYYTGNALFNWSTDGKSFVTVGCPHSDIVIDKAVAATCTATGLTEGKHCGYCGKVLVAQKETAKLGHDYKDGKCSRCGAADPSYVAVPALKISVTANGKPNISWNAVDGAVKYVIYRSTDGKSFKLYDTVTATNYINISTNIGTTYYYKVKAVNANNAESAFSAVKSAVCVPATPVVKITTSAGHPKLTWNAVDGATKYWIYRSTDGKNFKVYDTVTGTSYTNLSTTIGTTYYYKVQAVKVVDGKNVAGAVSAVVGTRCNPAAPTLSISRVNGKAKLSWNAVEGATKYWVYRSTDGKNFTVYTTVTGTSFTNSGAASGTKYFYKVQAVKVVNGKNIASAFSSTKSIITTLAQPSVSATTANGKPKLTWSAVTGADKYYIYRSTDGKNFSYYDTATSTSYTNVSAKKNTKYFYKVKAVCASNSNANSAQSKAVSVTATK